jgi:hypothetical protein
MLDLKTLVVEGQALHTTAGRCHGLSIPTGISSLSISATYDDGAPIARVVGWKATDPEGDLMAVAIFQKQGVWAPKDMHPEHPEYCNLTYYVLICDPTVDALQLIEVQSNRNTLGWKPGVALTFAQIIDEAANITAGNNLEEVEKTYYNVSYENGDRNMLKCTFTVQTNVERASLNWNAFQGFLEATHKMGLSPIHTEVCDTILHEEEGNATEFSHGNPRTLLIGQHSTYRQTSGCRFQQVGETAIQPNVSWVEADNCLIVRIGGQATTYHITIEALAVNKYTAIGQAIRKCYIKIGDAACSAADKSGAVKRRNQLDRNRISNYGRGGNCSTDKLPLRLSASLADAQNLGFCPSGSARWILSQIIVFKKMVALGFTKYNFENIGSWEQIPAKLLNTTLAFTLAEYRQMMKAEAGYTRQLFNSKSVNYAAIGRAIVKHVQ